MNKDELLKIYSAYLPYGLKVQLSEKDSYPNKVTELSGIMNFGLLFLGEGGRFGFTERDIEVVKPILYDLSYLTKEIEHEGERFVPIVELLKIKYPNQQGRYATTEYSTFGHPFACFSVDAGKTITIDTSTLQNQPYWIIQKLTEWKLNVFNLPEDQFINKATLNK